MLLHSTLMRVTDGRGFQQTVTLYTEYCIASGLFLRGKFSQILQIELNL